MNDPFYPKAAGCGVSKAMASLKNKVTRSGRQQIENLKHIIQDGILAGSIHQKTNQFAQKSGRRPRILVSSLDQNGYQRIIKLLATSFAGWGFDVDICPVHQSPKQVAKMAIENDVHIVCIASRRQQCKTVASRLIEALNANEGNDILVVVCGTIPPADHELLYRSGVAEILNYDAEFAESVLNLLNKLE
jgi:methylmalonyl-CoA mutase